MNVHEALDGLEGWVRSRQAQAPVSSSVSDIDRFTDCEPRDPHPDVDAADLSFGPSTGSRALWSSLPPARPARVETPLRFPSPVESPHPDNDTVRGVRWRGEGRDADASAVVMLHGAYAESFTAERLLSGPLFGRDVSVFALEAPYHMTRAPAVSDYSGQYLLSGDVPRFVDGLIQAVADVRALVASLREAGYDSVYLFGISLGGNVAAQAVTMADVDGAVLAIPAVDLFETVLRSPIAAGVRREAEAAGFEMSAVCDAMRPVTPRLLGTPVPDSSRVHVLYGQWDRQAPADAVEALLDAWPGASAVRYPAGHRTMGMRILGLRHQLAGWLDAQLAADRRE